MSRRREPAPKRGTPERGGGAGPALLAQVALLAAVLAVVTAIAELTGAANLGVALAIGQIAFLLALIALLLRR